MPSTCLNREQKSQGISAKNLQKNKVPCFLKVLKNEGLGVTVNVIEAIAKQIKEVLDNVGV